jgi:hypothetical protein
VEKQLIAIGITLLVLDIGLTLLFLDKTQDCRSEISSFDFFFPVYSESCFNWEIGSLVTAVFSFIGIGILLLGVFSPSKPIKKT